MKPLLNVLLSQLNVWKGEDALHILSKDTITTHTLSFYQRIKSSSRLLLNTQSFDQFLAGFLAGIGKKCEIFLGNYQWKETEWEAVLKLIKPDVILNNSGLEILSSFPLSSQNLETEATIMIPTGGSSGKIRFVKHNWNTLSASVRGFCSHFEQETVNCFCLLPLYHVSGLMQFMRTVLTGGHLILYSYKTIEIAWRDQNPNTLKQLASISQKDYFLSLVPTQLQRLIDLGAGNWLSQFKAILLGGSPAPKSLLETARALNLPLALTYGMTETASQIVTLHPNDFLKGNNSVGKVLPHAQVWISEEGGAVGRIHIKSESLGLGYYQLDANWNKEEFLTDDLGYFDQDGYLYIVGRHSRKIITGGENVYPEEVESAILSTGLVTDVYVVGLEDNHWGEIVSAMYVPKNDSVTISNLKARLKESLSGYKIPKQWLAVKSIPRNQQGKVNGLSIASQWSHII